MTAITRVPTVYGGYVHVATADLDNPRRSLLPLYNRAGERRSHTLAGLRAELRGEVLAIARDNIGRKRTDAEVMAMLHELDAIAAASGPSHPRMLAR